ncbi:MAG: type II toxin-antitoxin system prevent-host-death family antitoxin [Candidatus Sumerlaeota bacterium]|nr:type II toxin-antitoxin system prevent-host-death family antitoxin [Candidatus Sumerlaeota bacterium]
MLTIGITQLKTDTKKIMNRIKKGSEVIVTDHGKPVARITPEFAVPERTESEIAKAEFALKKRLAPMIRAGMIIPPSKPRRQRAFQPIVAPGKPLSEIVIEDRR